VTHRIAVMPGDGIASACIGGGEGIAALVENL